MLDGDDASHPVKPEFHIIFVEPILVSAYCSSKVLQGRIVDDIFEGRPAFFYWEPVWMKVTEIALQLRFK